MCQYKLVELATVVTSAEGQRYDFGCSSNHSVTVTRITIQNVMCTVGSGENYIMRSLMICIPHQILFG